MAVSKLLVPPVLSPAYNSIMVGVSSNKQALSGFEFVYDIYSASTNVFILRLKGSANPDGYGVKGINRILENFVDYDCDFAPVTTGITNTNYNHTFFKYDLQLGEQYLNTIDYNVFSSDPSNGYEVIFSFPTAHTYQVGDLLSFVHQTVSAYSGITGVHEVTAVVSAFAVRTDYVIPVATGNINQTGTTQYSDQRATVFSGLTAESGLTIFNGGLSHKDFRTYKYTDFTMTGSTGKFLTDCPNNLYAYTGDSFVWNIYNTGATNKARLVVQKFDGANTLIGQHIITAQTLTTDVSRVGVGPLNIENAIPGGNVWLGVASYNVGIYTSAIGQRSEVKTFRLQSNCSPYDNIQLYFLDRKGSWGTFNFIMKNTHTRDITRTSYKKLVGRFGPTATGYGWGYNSYDRGSTAININEVKQVVANTYFITESEATYIAQLYTSPEVYWKKDGEYIPIMVTTKNFEDKKTVNDRLIQYPIEFTYANQDSIQRG